MSDTKRVEEELLKNIKDTGFPTELKVAKKLTNLGWKISQSSYRSIGFS